MPLMKKNRGFTLIELLIVVAIIGIIAAIAIPNFMDGIERSKQKKSCGEIRTMVIAMQSFCIDYGGYPNSSYNGLVEDTWPTVFDLNGEEVIFPDLIQSVPNYDGWKQSYQYFASPDGAVPINGLQGAQVVASHYCVFSYGKDMADGGGGPDGAAPASDVTSNWCQEPPIAVGTSTTFCYESDIVWGDSQFQQSPQGKQKSC
jgi:type II secretion system protein G